MPGHLALGGKHLDYSAKLGLDSRIPAAPTGQEGMQALRGPSQAQDRQAQESADPSKVDVLSLPHLSLYLRKSPGIQ